MYGITPPFRVADKADETRRPWQLRRGANGSLRKPAKSLLIPRNDVADHVVLRLKSAYLSPVREGNKGACGRPEAGARPVSRPGQVTSSVISVPASALLTGQVALASPAIRAKSSADTPSADPLTVSLIPLMRKPPAGSGPSVTSALTSSAGLLPPAPPRSAENCIAKQAECAAAMSSSGLVTPPASSAARRGKLTS